MLLSFRLVLLTTVVQTVLVTPVSVYGQQSPAPVTPAAPSKPPDDRPVQRLAVDDAVRLALEQNLTIQVERLNPQIQDYAVAEARSVYTPYVSSSLFTNSADSPVNSFLSGGQDRVADDELGGNVGVNQLLPWGGSYNVSWDSSRLTTSNLFSNFDPTIRSSIDASFSQPLLRNMRIDSYRQQLLVSRKNREMSDIDLQQTVAATVRLVRNAYWDLSYALHSLEAEQTSLGLARELLRNNRSRVEIGTMAPIDIVEAEAEVARREEAVIIAEGAISEAEDRLKSLIFDPDMPDFWKLRLELSDLPAVDARPVDLDAAVKSALENRTDIRQARKQIEATDINIRYFHNQTLPDVNAQVDYSVIGLGGTQFIRGDGFPGPDHRSDRSRVRLGARRSRRQQLPQLEARPRRGVSDRRERGGGESGANAAAAESDRKTGAEHPAAGGNRSARSRPSVDDESEADRCLTRGPAARRAAPGGRGEEVLRGVVHQLLRVPGSARSRGGPQ